LLSDCCSPRTSFCSGSMFPVQGKGGRVRTLKRPEQWRWALRSCLPGLLRPAAQGRSAPRVVSACAERTIEKLPSAGCEGLQASAAGSTSGVSLLPGRFNESSG
jgi:hypothetical protein